MKTRTKYLIAGSIIWTLLCVASCEGPDGPGTIRPKYFRDKRTGLCFARYDRSITSVPCYDVEKLIKKVE